MKETLKTMKDMLVSQTQGQVANLQCVDYEELGAAIDMIKDLEEALYYCVIVEAMEKKDEDKPENNTYYYSEKYMPVYDYYRDMDRGNGRMYYNGGNSSSSSGTSNASMGSGQSGSARHYEYPMEMRDSREGRSPMSRRTYMESKEMHADKAKQLKELETYMSELTSDIAEMLKNSSPEEKQLLQKKFYNLQTQIEQMK